MREPHEDESSAGGGSVLRDFLRTREFLFPASLLLVLLTYGVLVEPAALVGIAIAVLGLPALVLLYLFLAHWKDRFFLWYYREDHAREHERHRADREARIAQPRWHEVSALTGGQPSEALKHLYGDPTLHRRRDVWVGPPGRPDEDLGEHVEEFQPPDGKTLEHPWYRHLPRGSFPFATDLSGDFLFVEMTPAGEDRPVYHWSHDGGDIVSVAPSLATFLEWLRATPDDDVDENAG